MLIAWYLGSRESKRLGFDRKNSERFTLTREISENERSIRRPRMFWFNIILTIVTVTTLISGKIAPAVVFMLGSTIALLANYPNIKDQRARIDSHAKTALLMATILLAAGVFTGIMKNTGMITEMANELVSIMPASMGKRLPLLLAFVSMPRITSYNVCYTKLLRSLGSIQGAS